MGFLQSALSGLKKDEDFKTEEKARRIQKILDDREKSIHERNLETFQENRRQEAIKKKMEKINLAQNRDSLFGNFSPGKNIFTEKKNVLHVKNTALKSKNKLKKQLFFK